MGHVLNNTVQDIYIRWHKLRGYNACWVPGTDHAGIATQAVVEKNLLKKGIRKEDLGREKFLKEVWAWKEKYENTIITQLKRLGAALDWDRYRFTLDEGYVKAVYTVFKKLFEKGLIYRGERIVNWDPKLQTALSDEEVIYQEEDGYLWYIKYPLKDEDGYITIATTRPETMLGDTAVAVNPNDSRYKHLIGKTAILPLIGRELPIIADDRVDPEFGTGALKVTPAHDPVDFEIGETHNLPKVVIMNLDGTINENGGKFKGLDRFKARDAIVKELDSQKLLVKIEKIRHSVGYSERSHVPIEPLLSKQWFIKMKPLAEPALKVVLDGKIRFHPEHWVKTYKHWMENIKDWCISRQLWWGHRIPLWKCKDGRYVFGVDKPEDPTCEDAVQEEDVLDTWASSWLWPFAVFGWPDETEDLNYYYPTNILVTGPDIIFFWVARMIMAGLEFTGKIPFTDVYFTGIIRDQYGRKLSKSLGNSPDPIDVINTYGADAVRFTVIYLTPVGNDIYYSNEKCEQGRNFANKIWNATRFLLLHNDLISEEHMNLDYIKNSSHIADKWILHTFYNTAHDVAEYIEKKFNVTKALHSIYNFIWSNFCDWYIEILKERLKDPNEDHKALMSNAVYLFEQSLMLLHPFMPFITEELWHKLRSGRENISILSQTISLPPEDLKNEEAKENMEKIQEIITTIRAIRGEYNIKPNQKLNVILKTKEDNIVKHANLIKQLTGVEKLTLDPDATRPSFSATRLAKGIEVIVPLEGVVDIAKEKQKLEKELAKLEKRQQKLLKTISSENYKAKAPIEVQKRDQEALATIKEEIQKIKTLLSELQ